LLFLLKCLVGQIDFRDRTQKDQYKLQLLVQQVELLPTKPNFVTVISRAFEDVESLQADFLHRFTKSLKLNLINEIMIGLAVAKSHQANVQPEGS
jgi:hypothetical protein